MYYASEQPSIDTILHGQPARKEFALWIMNTGYILYEINEIIEKGRRYFSITQLMNIWDILISLIWIILLIMRILSVNEISISNFDTFHQMYYLLFAVVIFLISTRFLTIFQSSSYLGSLLRIIQLMMAQVTRFAMIVAVVIASFVFGLYYINGVSEDSVNETFWSSFINVFLLFLGEISVEESEPWVAVTLELFIIVFGMVILSNILIALMAKEYEKFDEIANEEVLFLRTETYFDLANRDRSMPPPFNVPVLIITVIIRVIITLLAICGYNAYAHINQNTLVIYYF